MNPDAGYTRYHPRWLRPRMSTYWWLRRRSHLAFILRELSSLFVAWFVVYVLWLLQAVGQGETAYREFWEWSGQPLVVALNLVSLFFLVFHAVTWFHLAPQAMVIRAAGRRIPPVWVVVGNYLAWALTSLLVAWLLLGGRG